MMYLCVKYEKKPQKLTLTNTRKTTKNLWYIKFYSTMYNDFPNFCNFNILDPSTKI